MARIKSLKIVSEFPRRVEIFLFLLIGLIVIGTLGFKLATGSSFFNSFILTLEALAFMFHFDSGPGKFLEIFMAIFGVFLIWWILWSLFDMLLEGNLREYLKISSFLTKLRKMRNHYIIAGGGRVGEELAKSFSTTKKEFIIIEKDEAKVNLLKKKGFFAIYGDVTNEEVLKEANIKFAKTIILAMPETEKNLLVTMTARELNPNIEIYARADKPSFVSKLKKAGAKIVIVPEVEAAEKFIKEIK